MEDGFNTDSLYSDDAGLAGEKFEKPRVRQVCILYSISVFLLLFLASRVQRREIYSGIIITEFVLILLPPLIFLFLWKYDFRKVLRLNRISPMNIFLIFLIMIFSIPVVNVLNTLYLLLIKAVIGRVVTPNIPVASDIKGLIVNVLVVAGSAGICEEILFRGVIMRGLERFGAAAAILLSSLLFGIWHAYFPSLLGTFLLGIPIGFVVYRSNSLFGGMFAHFTNNALAVLTGFISKMLSRRMGSSAFGGISSQLDTDKYLATFFAMSRTQLAAVIITWIFMVLFCGSILAGLIVAFVKNTSGKQPVRISQKAAAGGAMGLLWLIPGLAFISFKYYLDGLLLRGIRTGLIDNILRFIGLK